MNAPGHTGYLSRRRLWAWSLVVFIGLAGLVPGWLASAEGDGDGAAGTALQLNVTGAIGPATLDYVERGLEHAREINAGLVILRMDTPGGLDTAMRDIIKQIINSPIPVATYVAPSGARAASAGTYILYASHVAAMAPATNLGAATPVQIGGGGVPGMPSGDEQSPADPGKGQDAGEGDQSDSGQSQDKAAPSMPSGDAMKHKVVNDAVAYIRGLAEMRGRNADWAEKAVREAASLPADKAVEMNVVDLVANDVRDLLAKLDGRTVKILDAERVLQTADMTVQEREPDWRSELLAIITNPNVAYILMLVGIYGLIFEFSNPGAFVPGIAGAICLLLALYAFQVLPVNYAGLALILLGAALMVGEAFAPSFGALGIGGVIAFVVGSIILMDTDVPGYGVSLPLIGGIALLSAAVFTAVLYLAVRARGRPVVSGQEELIGGVAVSLDDFEREGTVRVHSENWRALSTAPVRKGQQVRITALNGLTLSVEPIENNPEESMA